MATVIDELVVALKLDPKQFDQATKDTVGKLRQFERDHERHSKKIAKDTEGLTQAFSLLQGRLLAIAGLFMGGMGISQFTEHIAKLTAQTGFLANSLGISTAEITKWQGVGATVGATAGEMAQAVAAIRQGQSDIQLGRQSGLSAFSYMTHQANQGPGVDIFDSKGNQRSGTDILMDISRWLQSQKEKGPEATNNATRTLSSLLGMGQGTINTLMLGPDELQKRLKDMEKYAPDARQVKKFTELQEAMARTAIAAEALGRMFAERLAGPLTDFFNIVTKIIDKISGFLGHENEQKTHEFLDKTMPEASGGSTSIFGRVKSWVKRKTGIGGSDEDGSESSPGGVGGGTSGQPPGGAANDNAVTGPGSSGAPAKVGKTGWWTPERKQYAVDYLMKNANLPEISARAMVARWAGVEATGGPGEVNSIGATGIAQWLGARKRGVVVGDFEGQLGHAVRELRGPESRAYKTLLGARDARSAATGASMFERAEGYDPNTGTDNFTGKTMNFMKHIPGGTPTAPTTPAEGSFDAMWNNRIGKMGGAGAALRSQSSTVNNNTRSSQTSIGNMNVTVPPGADPAGYARGISQELQRFDPVMNANEGLL